jgi:hypothetical protein
MNPFSQISCPIFIARSFQRIQFFGPAYEFSFFKSESFKHHAQTSSKKIFQSAVSDYLIFSLLPSIFGVHFLHLQLENASCCGQQVMIRGRDPLSVVTGVTGVTVKVQLPCSPYYCISGTDLLSDII